MDWGTIIKIAHIIGTVLGVGGETLGSIFYFQAMKDGKIDLHESATLRVCFAVLHVGLVILVLSGFGYFLNMRIGGSAKHIFDPRIIAKLSLVVILLFNAILLQSRKIPTWIGGAISITSWYAALILGAWRGMPGKLWQITLVYLAFIVVAAVGERLMRRHLSIPL